MRSNFSYYLLVPCILGALVETARASNSYSSWLSDPVIRAWYADYLADSLDLPEDRSLPSLVPLAKIKNGTVRGQIRYSGTTKILRWLGIPYAAAPVGDLRFQAPQPYQGWGTGNYQATSHPNACPQFRTNLTKADEDCLFLSIYSRRKTNSAEDDGRLLPVIYFIHGGGYAFGQNSVYTGAKLLANEEVVLVTVQYRLGPLGFFSTGDNTVSSNNAMKDMVQGLKWVQENIAAFGGDPNQVTVQGESAGSASALYMLISPLAQGLFHRVVAMSGTPIQEWAIDRNPWDSAQRLGALLNCSSDTSQELVACLRDIDALLLSQAGLGVIIEDFQDFRIVLHGTTPVIEGDVPGAFLPDDPLKLLLEGPLPQVPVMLGSVQHEGILPLAGAHFLVLNPKGLLNNTEYMQDYLLGDLLRTYGVNERQDGASISQSMALGFLSPDKDRTNFTEIQYELLDMLSSVFMKAPILRTANILSRRLPAVYLYSFEYFSKNSLYNLAFNMIQLIIGGEKPPMKPGICHADDLIYMFNLPFLLSLKDQKFSRSYVELFTNFAVHGNPTPETTDKYPVWPRYDSRNQQYLKMAQPFEVKTDYTASWRQGMPNA